ncbi:MAG: hypothetical protein ACR2QR_02145 [Woeseiaceae bacterium]
MASITHRRLDRTRGEDDMDIDRNIVGLARTILFALIVTVPMTAIAGEPPPFTFNDRCVPYELDPDFMLANGVDPDKILTTFGGGTPPDDGTGNSGNPAPWTQDFEADGVTPKPCDEFHTHNRRTRYEGCHFYDGTPCYFTTNGQLDQDAFTDDEAGRIAFEIAEHFVIYEVVQNLEASPPFPAPPFNYAPAPIFTDPFAGGFAVGTQTKIMNTLPDSAYFKQNPTGVWKIGFIQFTPKADVCRSDFVTPDCVYMNNLTAANGTASQNIGYPLIYTGDEIFELTERGLVSIRYRLGADGVPGGPDGPRYILCPVHDRPDNGDISAGNDIIQGFPTHIEFQPPDVLLILPDPFTPVPPFPRGHARQSLAFPFGLTPPPGNPSSPFNEQSVYDNFDCLQRTGLFCL